MTMRTGCCDGLALTVVLLAVASGRTSERQVTRKSVKKTKRSRGIGIWSAIEFMLPEWGE